MGLHRAMNRKMIDRNALQAFFKIDQNWIHPKSEHFHRKLITLAD